MDLGYFFQVFFPDWGQISWFHGILDQEDLLIIAKFMSLTLLILDIYCSVRSLGFYFLSNAFSAFREHLFASDD